MARSLAYFDTSVLVKRYVREDGSARAQALLRRHEFASSSLAPVEAISALCRRRAAGDLAARDLALILGRMRDDRACWDLVEATGIVLGRAEDLIRQTGVRTLDAVHLASALTLQSALGAPLPFVTAAVRQGEAAQALGMAVVLVG